MTLNSSYLELGGALLTGVLGPLAVQYFKSRLDKKPQIDPVLETSHLNVTVNEQICNLREELEADRVWITQFHNGGHFYPTGKSIQKFSMFYENVSDGTLSVQDQFQNIPISLFAGSIHHVLTEDYLCIPDFSKPSLVPFGLQYVSIGQKSQSLYMFALKDIKERFLGTMGIEFIGRKGELNDKSINDLKIKSARIASILDNHLITVEK
jgi:hypothetical protein